MEPENIAEEEEDVLRLHDDRLCVKERTLEFATVGLPGVCATHRPSCKQTQQEAVCVAMVSCEENAELEKKFKRRRRGARAGNRRFPPQLRQ